MNEYHIRVGVKVSGRRINDRGHEGRTLCGAPITSEDAAGVRDARAIVRKGWQHPRGLKRCEGCFQRLLAMDFKRSAKVED